MELDEVDPARWAQLEAATAEYVAAPATQALLAEAAAALGQQVRPSVAVSHGGWGGRHLSLLSSGRAAGCLLVTERLARRRRPPLPRDLACSPPPIPGSWAQAEAGCGASACDAAQAAAAAPADVRLGARRRLVVVRAPRLGASQRAGLADAVAASLAHRPGCAAAIDLQQLGAASPPGSAGPDLQLAEAAAQRVAASAARSSVDQQSQAAVPAAALAPAGHRSEQQPGSSQLDAAPELEAEGGGLTAYLSSWFGSPTKQPVLAQPTNAGGAAATASGAAASSSSRPASARLEAAAASGAAVGCAASPRGTAPEVGAAVSSAAAGDPGPAAAAASLVGELEERLEPLLPTVGVLHLGLDVAGSAGAVLRWRQRLQVVAEPSEWVGHSRGVLQWMGHGCPRLPLVHQSAQQSLVPLRYLFFHCASLTWATAPQLAGQEATSILEAAGCDAAATRLADLFSQQPCFDLPGSRTLTVLSSQTHWADGKPLSMLLLSASSPDALLPATSLGLLGQLLRGQLVVTAAALPADFVAALLAQGAKGVVCSSGASSNIEAVGDPAASVDGCCAFFAAFYDALLAGKTVSASLQAAELQRPSLRGCFHLCTACET